MADHLIDHIESHGMILHLVWSNQCLWKWVHRDHQSSTF